MYQSHFNSFPPTSRSYANQGGMGYILSAVGQGQQEQRGNGYRIGGNGGGGGGGGGVSRRDGSDLGLLPSLSRRVQKNTTTDQQYVASEPGLKEETIFGEDRLQYPTTVAAVASQDVEIEEGHGDQTVKWG